jgi:hypothetical protein
MIRQMRSTGARVAVVGTNPSDEPFPFTSYVAIASARDHLGPVVVHADHLPYGVWWDRLRPTIELARDGDPPGETLPLNGLWTSEGQLISTDDEAYPLAVAAYRTGDGLF